MRSSIRLGSFFGIDVGIHWSLFGVMALVSWSLAEGFLPDEYPNWSTATYWITGVVSAVFLFSSVLVHEFAHSLVAKSRGFPVEGITLFLLGGVSSLKSESRKAKDEFIISAVGPLTSFALGVVFGLLLAIGVGGENTPASWVVFYLMLINLLLGLFNLLPAFPLDGGRVLRSIIWGATGSLYKATRIVAGAGQLFGMVLMGVGAYSILTGNLLGFLGGLWYALIGWFLHSAASNSRSEAMVESEFRGVKVRDVMDDAPPMIDPTASIHDAIYDQMIKRGGRSISVCDGDKLLGILTLTDVKRVPRERWEEVTVAQAMTRIPLKHVGPNDDLYEALEQIGEQRLNQAPVLEGDRLVGMLSRADLVQYLHSRRELGA